MIILPSKLHPPVSCRIVNPASSGSHRIIPQIKHNPPNQPSELTLPEYAKLQGSWGALCSTSSGRWEKNASVYLASRVSLSILPSNPNRSIAHSHLKKRQSTTFQLFISRHRGNKAPGIFQDHDCSLIVTFEGRFTGVPGSKYVPTKLNNKTIERRTKIETTGLSSIVWLFCFIVAAERYGWVREKLCSAQQNI